MLLEVTEFGFRNTGASVQPLAMVLIRSWAEALPKEPKSTTEGYYRKYHTARQAEYRKARQGSHADTCLLSCSFRFR